MIKPSLVFLLALALCTLVSQQLNAQNSPRLDTILNKHLEAMGGLYNWNKVESIRLSGTVERDGQVVDIVIVKKRPNQIRATVTIPVPGKEDEYFQIIRAHDGKTAWTAKRLAGAPNMLKEELPQGPANELLVEAGVLPPLIKFWREGAKLELLSPETVDGQTTFRIRVTDKNLPSQYTFYISNENFLVIRYKSIDSKQRITQTTLGNYSKAHDVLIPTQNSTEASQTGHSLMNTSSIQVGIGIYKEYFEVGESIDTAKLQEKPCW